MSVSGEALAPNPSAKVRQWQSAREERGFWHSFEFDDGTKIDGVCEITGLRNRLDTFNIPLDLRGKRVLDIGTWDGWFAFEMERRGASVVAIDNWDNPRFHEVHARLGSQVSYEQADVYELIPERFGRFDIVLFMGVLYHLKHPLLALERVCALTLDLAAVDSFILRSAHRPGSNIDERPVMEFYETTEFGGQTDNWVAPSLPCLIGLCRTAGFARAEVRSILDYSACISCYRTWGNLSGTEPSPDLTGVQHTTKFGMNFDSRRDEYITAWLSLETESLALDDVYPSVSGFGVRPVTIEDRGAGAWQINFKLPPGLDPGYHEVRIATKGRRASNPRTIAVDVPVQVSRLVLLGTADGVTWTPGQLDTSVGRVISVFVTGLPDNADPTNIWITCGDAPLTILFFQEPVAEQPRQINAVLPEHVRPGVYPIRVQVDVTASEPLPILIT